MQRKWAGGETFVRSSASSAVSILPPSVATLPSAGVAVADLSHHVTCYRGTYEHSPTEGEHSPKKGSKGEVFSYERLLSGVHSAPLRGHAAVRWCRRPVPPRQELAHRGTGVPRP